MTKKTFTMIFLLVATVLNILFALILIAGLVLLTTVLLRLIVKGDSLANVVMIDWMLCFVGGVVLNMYLYSKITNWAIAKFHLGDKLDPRLLGKKGGFGGGASASSEPPKRKTVLPKSVMSDEKEDTWGQTSYGDNSTYTPLNPEDFRKE